MGKRLIQLGFVFLLQSTTVVKCLTGRGENKKKERLLKGSNIVLSMSLLGSG